MLSHIHLSWLCVFQDSVDISIIKNCIFDKYSSVPHGRYPYKITDFWRWTWTKSGGILSRFLSAVPVAGKRPTKNCKLCQTNLPVNNTVPKIIWFSALNPKLWQLKRMLYTDTVWQDLFIYSTVQYISCRETRYERNGFMRRFRSVLGQCRRPGRNNYCKKMLLMTWYFLTNLAYIMQFGHTVFF